MSAIETEREIILRTFPAEVTSGDGRTVDVRIVPFGETARAIDGLGGVAKGIPYEEEWMPNVFERQTKAANRILLNVEHERGISGIVGHGIALRQEADGYHGSFRLHETPDGEKALHLVKEGVYTGVSLEAFPQRSIRAASGVIQRVKGILDAVALCRVPAFDGARVLAVREEQAIVLDSDLYPSSPDPEVLARCRALGLKMPQRYAEHPDDTDTSDDDESDPSE